MELAAATCERCGTFVSGDDSERIGARRVCGACAQRLRVEIALHPHGRLLALGVFGNLPAMLWLHAKNLERLGFDAWVVRGTAVVSGVIVPFAFGHSLARSGLQVAVMGLNVGLAWAVLRSWEARLDAHLKQGGARASRWEVVLPWLGFAMVMLFLLKLFVPVTPARG